MLLKYTWKISKKLLKIIFCFTGSIKFVFSGSHTGSKRCGADVSSDLRPSSSQKSFASEKANCHGLGYFGLQEITGRGIVLFKVCKISKLKVSISAQVNLSCMKSKCSNVQNFSQWNDFCSIIIIFFMQKTGVVYVGEEALAETTLAPSKAYINEGNTQVMRWCNCIELCFKLIRIKLTSRNILFIFNFHLKFIFYTYFRFAFSRTTRTLNGRMNRTSTNWRSRSKSKTISNS